MSLNLELKASIASIEEARNIALELRADPGGRLEQVDTYFNVPQGRLKLRVINGTSAELIGYYRKEQQDERWSDYEKTPVTDPEGLRQILASALGIRVVVRKQRELFWYEGSRIHLDQVDGLGTYLEFEIPAQDKIHAEDSMRKLRDLFGIRPENVLRQSYSDFLLARNGKR